MNCKHILFKLNKYRLQLLCTTLIVVFILSGCGKKPEESEDSSSVSSTEQESTVQEGYEWDDTSYEDFIDYDEPQIDVQNSDLYEMISEEIEDEMLIAGEVKFNPETPHAYASEVHCLFDMPTQNMVFQCKFDKIPSSDDTNIYLFVFDTYEDANNFSQKGPTAAVRKGHTIQISLEYKRTYLFARFVPALLVDNQYVSLSTGKYIGNPDLLAPNLEEYPNIPSKKGLLLDPVTIGTEKLTDLGISQAIYNIPLSQIIGETTDPSKPTIEFEYNDRIYYFNGATVAAYDGLFSYLDAENIYATAIILNDWNENYPEMIHPLSRKQGQDILYYAFNTEEEEGVRLMEATALFLAERYTSGFHGKVYNWVIANEVNQQTSWNYMNTTDLLYYTDSFEKSFRIFYNALKSRYSGVKVYFSIDHDWNDNGGKNAKWFNGRELLEVFNKLALYGGNYDWNIAIHPYPVPLTRVNYWSNKYDMTEGAEYLTIMNLSTLTSVLEKEEYRNLSGDVRRISVTELGFTSRSGEKLQAAAFAYCYYILDNNPYVDAFMLNRQTDAREEMKNGLSFGIYNPDLSSKYMMEVFKYIDTDRANEYLPTMLKMIKATSLEEALSRANP